MKQLGLVLSLCLASATTFAANQNLPELRKVAYEKMESCGDAIFSDDQWLAASLPNTANGIGHVRIQSLQNPGNTWDFPAHDTVVDIKIKDGKIFVLTETTFEAWDLATYKSLYSYASHPEVGPGSKWSKKATGFIFRADKILITHGVLGFSLLNPETGIVEKTIPMPTISSAQDITVLEDKTALVAVDNADDAQFRGLYVLNLSTLDIEKQIKIDNAFPLSLRVLPGNRLMMGYLNAIWKFDITAALKGEEAQPNRRSWKFPGLFDVDMRGKVFYDETYMYSCFGVFQDMNGGMVARKKTPLAFKIDDLKLN